MYGNIFTCERNYKKQKRFSKLATFHHKKEFSGTNINSKKFNSLFFNKQIGPEIFNKNSQTNTCFNAEIMQCDYSLPNEFKNKTLTIQT